MTGLTILGAVLILGLSGILFLNFYPAVGGSPSKSKIELFENSENHQDGRFVNQIPTSMDMGFFKFMSVLKDWIFGVPNQSPQNPLPVLPVDSLTIAAKNDSVVRVTWFGHSAFLLEIAGKNILLDPMLGDYTGPHRWLGPGRFSDGIPIEIEKLPKIDAVIYSHDHYDHLDYASVQKLKDKVDKFLVPMGVGSHLESWDITNDKIKEFNWWDAVNIDNVELICAPARHFSGRGILDRNKTLWASWIIRIAGRTIYFSGDSGYGPHFKEICEKYGPFDFAMLECGQYDLRWESIHMMPEQTAQSALDLKAETMMPIHWGSFVLALHSWNDPVIRVTQKALELGVNVITPQIGEQITFPGPTVRENNWWLNWK